ncbi:helix-turn-helix transcriptional regulator [Psychrosphaera sp. F3M07]|uniref:helix-turn-helix domain-containing protein n=1 Tax=Psychrosphaera sp. F3M07 TaxID=2841560 RepID=UPI001C09208A|nr:helix-turn-helix transcriptional regulator [Psychrosphaera sp. F3M07]MBU2918069.1 helix-turn-helix transcriptional regulator [Psychrosphaera sp. F3M07]
MQKTTSAEPYRKLISWLSEQRQSQNITMPELAKQLGLASHSYISKIENLERKIDLYEHLQICEALGVDGTEGYQLMLTAHSKLPKKVKT